MDMPVIDGVTFYGTSKGKLEMLARRCTITKTCIRCGKKVERPLGKQVKLR